jgi:hypothetical protein
VLKLRHFAVALLLASRLASAQYATVKTKLTQQNRGKERFVKVRIKRGLFGRFYIFHPENDRAAWSGGRWVSAEEDGAPAADVQVCKGALSKTSPPANPLD